VARWHDRGFVGRGREGHFGFLHGNEGHDFSVDGSCFGVVLEPHDHGGHTFATRMYHARMGTVNFVSMWRT
jgi:hypothetical protein